MPLYDQLIEFAREKQRGRRCVGVHKSVPNPILVIVIGDKQCEFLDPLYTQLSSRWSSQLKALQVCYCYVKTPYEGSSPILQAKLELPDRGGAGAVCSLPDTLSAVNDMIGQAIDRIGQESQTRMMRADIHIVLAPEDPAGMLLSDLAAVAKGRLEDSGVITTDCRLYLLLSSAYRTKAECGYVCGVMDQLREAQAYEQAVLQPQQDAAPLTCRINRLINAVMLLDDVNEHHQHYNAHGERLGLLLDLVENGWSNTGFIQTAGVRDGSAGPEYWLAQAADFLCSARREQAKKDAGVEIMQVIIAEITAAAQDRTRGLDRALDACRLFVPGQVGRVGQLSLDNGETAVFGGALQSAYASWQKNLPEMKLPGKVLQVVEDIESDDILDVLIYDLESWAEECERQAPAPLQNRPKLPSDGGEAAAALYFRNFLLQEKYQLLVKKEEQHSRAELVRSCAKNCRQRKKDLRTESEEFADFAREIQQVWATLRDAYNDGGKMQLTWIDKKPAPGALRKAGALAVRTGDPTQVLTMVADCVDLSGDETEGAQCAAPPLFCRIPFADELSTRVQPITQGVSSGRVLKFAVISQEYDEEMLRRVHALKYAREKSLTE